MNVSQVLKAAVLVLVAALLPGPSGVLAQSATLTGLVVSASDGAPLPGVLVVLESGRATKSDHGGAFHIKDVAPGAHRVALVAPACQITYASVRPQPGQEVTVAFQAIFDPEVLARAKRRAAAGRVIGAAEIERMRARDLSDVLVRTFPWMSRSRPSQPGHEARLRSRSSVSATGPLEPAVIVDGANVGPSSLARIDDISMADVAWIQVARGAAGGWEVGTGGSGGLIRIQTKRGLRMEQPFVEPEWCEIPAWGS